MSHANMQNFTDVTWTVDTQELTIPLGIQFALDECLKTATRFISFPLALTHKVKKSGTAHANAFLYDKKDRSLEQFEPNGRSGTPHFENSNKAIFVFAKWLNGKYGSGFVKSIYPMQDFCPWLGLQALEVREKLPALDSDPLGFCAIWTSFYVFMRFDNPDLTRTQVIATAIRELKTKSFRTFIREYGTFATKLLKDLQDNPHDLETVLKKYIV